MYLGGFVPGGVVTVIVNTHKFETGEVWPATLTGYTLKMGDDIANKVDITFNLWNGETGRYFAEIDLTGFSIGGYQVYVTALIDLKTVRVNFTFRVPG